MNGNTYGKVLLSSVSFTSISCMTFLIYQDTMRQHNNNLIQNEEINDIILPNSTLDYTDMKFTNVNQYVIPTVNNDLLLKNMKDYEELSSLDVENLYFIKPDKYDLVSFTTKNINKNIVYEDNYDKFLNYFE